MRCLKKAEQHSFHLNEYATPSPARRKADTFTAWGGTFLKGALEGVRMKKPSFKFTDTQRHELLKCWVQHARKKNAAMFLDDAEFRIDIWLENDVTKPHTAAANKIAIAKRLNAAATEMLAALNEVPTDVASFLNVVWYNKAYGSEHHQRICDAYDADQETAIDRLFSRSFALLAGKEPPPELTEVDKLPPDFLKQLPGVKGWLEPLARAAGDMESMLVGAKQWNSKELEKSLIFSFAIGYRKCFGKPPSAANGSIFRRFAKELSGVLTGYEFGADIVKACCKACASLPPGFFNRKDSP